MNPNYIKQCNRIVGEHDNMKIIAIWDEPIKKVEP
jgi:hypothetical protein